MSEKIQHPEGNEGEPQNLEGTEGEPTPDLKPEAGEGAQPSEPDEKDKRISDLEGRISENERGVQKLLNENRNLKNKAADLEATLSEKELAASNSQYEFMSDEEKKEYREKLETKKRLLLLEAKEKWREDFRKLPAEIKTKIEKAGGEDAFKDFSFSQENVEIKNIETLAKAFVFNVKEDMPTPPTPPKPKSGLDSPHGGQPGGTPPQKEGYTSEEVRHMRIKEPDRYIKLAREGKLIIRDK